MALSVSEYNAKARKSIADLTKQGKTVYTREGSDGKLHYSVYSQANVDNLAGYNVDRYAEQLTNESNLFNQESAQKQMDFQERMSNTSHQREVADLTAAGLNPVLSANNGASTTNGSVATYDSSGANYKAQMSMQQAQLNNARAITEMNNATALEQTRLNNAQSAENLKNQLDAQQAMNLVSSQYGLLSSQYAANSSYAASRYASDISAQNALLSSNTSKENLASQLQWDSEHPNNAFTAAGEVLSRLLDWSGSNSGKSALDSAGSKLKSIGSSVLNNNFWYQLYKSFNE